MKTTKLIVCTVICALLSSIVQSQIISNSKPITNEGEFSTPIWSPDGQKILFTDHHNDALFVIDISKNNIKKIKKGQGIGYLPYWSADGKSVIFREKPEGGTFSDVQVKSINLLTGKEATLKDVYPNSVKTRISYKSNKNLIVYINQKTLKLEAREGIQGKPWVISKEDGQFYHPIVSPDQKSVIVHDGPTIYLYSIYESQERKELGFGIASSWLPDSKGVITFEDESKDGHSVTASDLYFISTLSLNKKQLTSTKDQIEMWGDVSPDGKRIAFSDEKSGRIFIADLKLKN
ncbi:TolB family protein [Aquimarina sp. M1]